MHLARALGSSILSLISCSKPRDPDVSLGQGQGAGPGPAEWAPAEDLPFAAATTRVEIDQIRGTGPSDIWLLCRGVVDGRIDRLAFHHDGAAWRAVDLPAKARTSLYPVAPDDVWAVGLQGTLAHFDGAAWRVLHAPDVDYDFLDVWVSDDGVVWIAPAGPSVVRYERGRWEVVSPPALQGSHNSVQTLTGRGRELLVPVNSLGEPSWVAHHQDGAWRTDEVGPGGLVLVVNAGGDALWAVSRRHQAFHFDGARWTRHETTPLEVRAAAVSPTGEAWLVGEAGTILRWDGATFQPSPSGTTAGLWSVYAPAPGVVLVGGDRVYRPISGRALPGAQP